MADLVEQEVIVGSGEFRYRFVDNWAKLPKGWQFLDVSAVAVDKQDQVYVFNRGGHPMIIFDRDGNVVSTWGENIFKRPHGLHMGPDESIYCTDDGDHTVRKCTLDGKVLLELGTPGQPAPALSGDPFNRCTHTALSPENDIYVSDGYQNTRVHKYSSAGKLLLSWGESGSERGQFSNPHNICCDAEGWVYVADRENNRVQVFDGNGKYETQWNQLFRPCALYQEYGTATRRTYIGELPTTLGSISGRPNLGACVKVVDKDGELIARIGGPHATQEPGEFVAPHGIAVDSHGDIYVGEVSYTSWAPTFPKIPRPEFLRTLTKLVKV